jgi:fumarate reductase subunit D
VSTLVLRAAEWLIRGACRRLPEAARDDRYEEWTSELPHILSDPGVHPAPRRAVKALLFAADQHRTVRRLGMPRAGGLTSALSAWISSMSRKKLAIVVAVLLPLAVLAGLADSAGGVYSLVVAVVGVAVIYLVVIIAFIDVMARRRGRGSLFRALYDRLLGGGS